MSFDITYRSQSKNLLSYAYTRILDSHAAVSIDRLFSHAFDLNRIHSNLTAPGQLDMHEVTTTHTHMKTREVELHSVLISWPLSDCLQFLVR